MKRDLILLLTLILGVAFEFTGRGEKVDWFLFNEFSVYVETWYYYFFEHARWIYIAGLYVYDKERDFDVKFAYLLIMVGDFIDFVLTYNMVYFRVGDIPISYNVLSVMFFSYVLWKKYNN